MLVFWHKGPNFLLEFRQICFPQGRQRYQLSRLDLGSHKVQMREQLFFVLHHVNLVYRNNHWRLSILKVFSHVFIRFAPLETIQNKDDQINICNDTGGRAIHNSIDSTLLIGVNTRCINKDHLHCSLRFDTQQGVPRCLWFPRGDAQLLTQDVIE